MVQYNDYPLAEVAAEAQRLIATGCEVHQKFTCEKCSSRLAVEEPNTFFKTGHCDKCGHITNIEKRGCNYLVFAKVRQNDPAR